MTPTVSVCAPVYNGARFLPSAFESLSRQTYRDFEVVMVDDGSSDGSGDLARDLMSRFDLSGQVIVTTNHGAEQARDTSCMAARGGLLAPFDCDDTWEPTYLAEMVAALNSDPGIGLVYCDFDEEFIASGSVVRKSATTPWIERAKATKIGSDLYRFEAGSFFSMLLLGGVLFPPCTMFRRDVYDAAGGYSSVNPLPKPHPSIAIEEETRKTVCLDWGFGLRVSKVASVAYLDHPLLRKTRHAGNSSGNAAWTAKCDVKVLRAVVRDPALSAQDMKATQTRLARRALDAGYADWTDGKSPSEARSWLVESFRAQPTMKTLALVTATMIPPAVVNFLRQLKRGSTG